MEHSVEQVLLGLWRLDFPILDWPPCHVGDDVVNILVHSLDKHTKLYALDRRQGKDPKGTVVRPYFLMRDHESGGRCLAMLPDGTTVCSAGKDGRVVLRDVSPYQKRLTPIPPSKEKRKPIAEAVAWHFTDGGVTDIAVTAADGRIVCVGGGAGVSGGVVKVIAVASGPRAGPAGSSSSKEVTWRTKDCSAASGTSSAPCPETGSGGEVGVGPSEKSETPGDAETRRKATTDRIRELRAEWAEQMKHLNEVDVPVDDLLLDKEKSEFHQSCADAIFAMREEVEYYGQHENQYVQDVVRKMCCETMEVPRMKVVSLFTPNLEVHNSHVAKRCRPRVRVAKKLAFLRALQRTSAGGPFASSSTTSRCEAAQRGTTTAPAQTRRLSRHSVMPCTHRATRTRVGGRACSRASSEVSCWH